MVTALDHPAEITIEQIAEKTFKITCHDCDWMETGGSQAVATRKRNKHRDEHKAAVHGSPEIPTIIDAIEGVDNVPEVAEVPTPVRDLDYFRQMKAEALAKEAAAFNAKHANQPPEPCPWDCLVEHEHIVAKVEPVEQPQAPMDPELYEKTHCPVTGGLRCSPAICDCFIDTHPDSPNDLHPEDFKVGDLCSWCGCFHIGGPENCNDVGQKDARGARDGQESSPPTPPFPPRGMELPRTPLELTTMRLELQKGSSDRDREKWLAERAVSVSATLVAKLGMASDLDFAIAEQVRLKIEGDPFTGNRYTEWGKHREPALEHAGQIRHGIVGESHLFFARANRRHSASPDGIRIHPDNGDVGLGEYKTSGKELTLQQVIANGYWDQMQWQMYVLEASHCWLMWEWRHEDPTQPMGFRPQVGGEHLVMRDDERIEELKRRADLFLAALDAARGIVAEEKPVAEDPRLKALVGGYLHAKKVVAQAESNLREYCELNDLKSVELEGLAKVSYSWGSARSTFDKEAFEAAYPGVYQQYMKPGKDPERPTLRVTARGDDE